MWESARIEAASPEAMSTSQVKIMLSMLGILLNDSVSGSKSLNVAHLESSFACAITLLKSSVGYFVSSGASAVGSSEESLSSSVLSLEYVGSLSSLVSSFLSSVLSEWDILYL